jgi:hypothetical protein
VTGNLGKPKFLAMMEAIENPDRYLYYSAVYDNLFAHRLQPVVPAVDPMRSEYQDFGNMDEYLKLLDEENIFSRLYAYQRRIGATADADAKVDESAVLINSSIRGASRVEKNGKVLDSDLLPGSHVGENSIVIGVDGLQANVPSDKILEVVPVSKGFAVIYAGNREVHRPEQSRGRRETPLQHARHRLRS